MAAKKDLTGQIFGRLTVLRDSGERRHNHVVWECLCSCENPEIQRIVGISLKSGKTQSCGCLRDEATKLANTKHGSAKKKGSTTSLDYVLWCNIKQRCYNVNHKQYKDYGGRGITMFSKWNNSFIAFRDYTLNLPNCPLNIEKANTFTDLYLDRINNNKGYKPGNLRWATREEQNNNRRSSRMIKFKGIKMTLKDAVDKHAVVKYDTVLNRLNKLGWSIEDALLRPKK